MYIPAPDKFNIPKWLTKTIHLLTAGAAQERDIYTASHQLQGLSIKNEWQPFWEQLSCGDSCPNEIILN